MTNTAKATRPSYAVRVVLTHPDGGTTERIYVRGTLRMGRSVFASFAVGDLIRLTEAQGATWTVEEVEAA